MNFIWVFAGILFTIFLIGDYSLVGSDVMTRHEGDVRQEIKDCEKDLPRNVSCKIIVVNPVDLFEKQMENNNPATRWKMESF